MKSAIMKPLNFLSLFFIFFLGHFIIGSVFYILEKGEFAVMIFVLPVAIVIALILATLALNIRATQHLNNRRQFFLNFLFWFCNTIAIAVTGTLSNIYDLTMTKTLLLLGIAIIGGFILAKVAVLANLSKSAP